MNKVRIHFSKVVICLLMMLASSHAHSALSCPAENRIEAQFENGAAWQMCWDSRLRENIVLSEHVTYDDSNVTYNDVTQFGLGAGYISTLTEEDCPGGKLTDIAGRAGLCELMSTGDDSYSTANGSGFGFWQRARRR